jgi:hypothetical protein
LAIGTLAHWRSLLTMVLIRATLSQSSGGYVEVPDNYCFSPTSKKS